MFLSHPRPAQGTHLYSVPTVLRFPKNSQFYLLGDSKQLTERPGPTSVPWPGPSHIALGPWARQSSLWVSAPLFLPCCPGPPRPSPGSPVLSSQDPMAEGEELPGAGQACACREAIHSPQR